MVNVICVILFSCFLFECDYASRILDDLIYVHFNKGRS